MAEKIKVNKLPEPKSVELFKVADFQMTSYEYDRLNYWLRETEKLRAELSTGNLKVADRCLAALENAYLILRPLLKGSKLREDMDKAIHEIRKELWLYKSGSKEKIDFWGLLMKFNYLHYTLKDIQDIVGAGITATSGGGLLEQYLDTGEEEYDEEGG